MPGFARLPDVRQIRQICAPYPGNGDSGGILIVDQLARAWGRDGNDQTGWTIWFEMECWWASARPPTGRSPAPRAAGQSRHTFILDGHRRRHLRRQRGLSQEDLADQAV